MAVRRERITRSGTNAEAAVAALEQAYAALGPLGYWRWRLAGLEQAATRGYVAPSEFAAVYAALGHNDAAFEWLERAYEERDAMDMLNVWPGYDPLRSDPRFDDLLRRMNFPE